MHYLKKEVATKEAARIVQERGSISNKFGKEKRKINFCGGR